MGRRGALTAREEAFVQEYLVDLNASAAFLRAGYRSRESNSDAAKVMARPRVQAAIQAAKAARAKRTEITADRVLQELANVAFGDPRRVLNWGPGWVDLRRPADELAPEDAALVASMTPTKDGPPKVKLQDKIAALRLLMAHLGMKTGDAPPAPPEMTQLAALAQALAATQGGPPHADAEPD